MRSQVIPAQITTVEDKIAGNLNLTQIMLLLFPAFWTTIVFTIFSPRLHFSLYKLPLVLLVLFICLALSLRIKGKVVLNWAFTILRYNLRPKYYVFNKNEPYLRTLDLPVFEKKQKVQTKKVKATEELNVKTHTSIGDLIRLDNLLANPKYSFSFKEARKGGLDVAFKQEQK
jgi:hypothetical protein